MVVSSVAVATLPAVTHRAFHSCDDGQRLRRAPVAWLSSALPLRRSVV